MHAGDTDGLAADSTAGSRIVEGQGTPAVVIPIAELQIRQDVGTAVLARKQGRLQGTALLPVMGEIHLQVLNGIALIVCLSKRFGHPGNLQAANAVGDVRQAGRIDVGRHVGATRRMGGGLRRAEPGRHNLLDNHLVLEIAVNGVIVRLPFVRFVTLMHNMLRFHEVHLIEILARQRAVGSLRICILPVNEDEGRLHIGRRNGTLIQVHRAFRWRKCIQFRNIS